MFLAACSSERWKQELRGRIGFPGHQQDVSEKESMSRAMSIFCYILSVYLDGFSSYCNLATLYLTVMEVEHEVEINEYWRAVLRKIKFLLRHAHCKHYCDIFFPDQIEYILQRKTARAMSLCSRLRLGRDSLVHCLDSALIKNTVCWSLDGDTFLANSVNYTSLDIVDNQFEALYAADWGA
jgi:hypothetical protein